MSDVHPRHRYGTYALILALLALAFSGFSKGAVWATVDDESTRTVQNEVFGELIVNVTIESDLHLREMDIEVSSTSFHLIGGFLTNLKFPRLKLMMSWHKVPKGMSVLHSKTWILQEPWPNG